MEDFDLELKWRAHSEDFDSNDRRVLLALSNKRWLWRNMERLLRVTELSQDDLTISLKHLMDDGYVRGSVSKDKRRPIFGLVERVGQGRSRKTKS